MFWMSTNIMWTFKSRHRSSGYNPSLFENTQRCRNGAKKLGNIITADSPIAQEIFFFFEKHKDFLSIIVVFEREDYWFLSREMGNHIKCLKQKLWGRETRGIQTKWKKMKQKVYSGVTCPEITLMFVTIGLPVLVKGQTVHSADPGG